MKKTQRLYLSPPLLSGQELKFIKDALRSKWITPLGPQVDAFEREIAEKLGVRYALALSSGTAAIHLALRHLRLRTGDEVFCSTFSFVASANPILYERAHPVFIDSDRTSWNMDPNLLEKGLASRAKKGRLPRAVIIVDLFGQCADYRSLNRICRRYDVPIIEDAAEALGADYQGTPAGSLGWAGVLSFNGNKIITTSGGGLLATNDRALEKHARFLSQQARDRAIHYEHSEMGFNYRMSNILAGIGRAQLRALGGRVTNRRKIFGYYRNLLGSLPGITFMPEAPYGRSNRWLTCVLIDPKAFGATLTQIREALEGQNIESRPLWKPLHLQPLFKGCERFGGEVSESLFASGLCLPSGPAMRESDVARVASAILKARRSSIR